MRLILLGPPGAGKGTQCKRVIDRYAMAHLSSGDILRSQRAAGTELGKKAQSYMDSGRLVPDDIIIDMMIETMKKAASGYVLDGFPRTVVQSEQLDKSLAQNGEKIDGMVNLQVNDEIISARLTGRRSCPKYGAVYHIENLKPEVDGICDKDGEKLIQRPDDNAEVVASRLLTYHEQTAAVVGYYQDKGNTVINIDAVQDVDDVTALIFAELDKLDGQVK